MEDDELEDSDVNELEDETDEDCADDSLDCEDPPPPDDPPHPPNIKLAINIEEPMSCHFFAAVFIRFIVGDIIFTCSIQVDRQPGG